MFGNSFYHGTLRKYVIVFGNMFNGIYLQRLNQSDTVVQTLKVPIAYGPKEKFLVRLAQDPNLDQDVAISLPRIGFEMMGISYAANRKLTSTQQNVSVSSTDTGALSTQYIPVPYDIQFRLSIFVKNADDGTQILEQILPYFQPEWTNNIKLIPGMDLTYDVPCILTDVSVQDAYEGDFSTRRTLMWDLNFTMKGYVFGPTSTNGIIKRASIDAHADLPRSSPSERITVEPGLTSTGLPTSNSALSVPVQEISADDDYGFATNITDV
jgi:hypothetical protein|tara:strand:+ start:456 stop:1256 length:801 start_codon:yes stop_codon:yes gene_type:complete